MTKQECLHELNLIAENTCNNAVYYTACNYYDTVDEMSVDDFDTVSAFYSEFVKHFKQ